MKLLIITSFAMQLFMMQLRDADVDADANCIRWQPLCAYKHWGEGASLFKIIKLLLMHRSLGRSFRHLRELRIYQATFQEHDIELVLFVTATTCWNLLYMSPAEATS
ncbi:hypothetical protein BRADI_3g15495v3 [Brachypodium distachyon]|uniref:FBD domain-containing protein n=1 Tax=Brachypodium distachyon TaxID=15368 RepID=A0A0Q3F6V3_BRADI|nr:hypothetical protein BRADI_3g15495v3 [Brachypodium distachyon]